MSARLLYIASFSLLNLIQIPAEVTFSKLPASEEGKNGDNNKLIQNQQLDGSKQSQNNQPVAQSSNTQPVLSSNPQPSVKTNVDRENLNRRPARSTRNQNPRYVDSISAA